MRQRLAQALRGERAVPRHRSCGEYMANPAGSPPCDRLDRPRSDPPPGRPYSTSAVPAASTARRQILQPGAAGSGPWTWTGFSSSGLLGPACGKVWQKLPSASRMARSVSLLRAPSDTLLSLNHLRIFPSRVPPIVRTSHHAGVVLVAVRPFCSDSRASDHTFA
jgi:hypothetical protein